MLFVLAAFALANSDSEPETEADTSGDSGGDSEGDGISTCDGIVVVETASGTARVPGDTSLSGSEESAACALREGEGDDDAVMALQTALGSR